MDKIVIEGGFPLNGEIEISGAKNSAIKLMAVCLLTDQPVKLTNMPRLRDTRSMGGLLEHLGVQIDAGTGSEMMLHAEKLSSTTAPYELVRKMRASFNVLGPLIARNGSAKVSLPGGCAIGARPVDLHLKAMESFGVDIKLEEGYVIAKAKGGLKGAEITFPFISVGATEHALLTAVLAKGETVLNNAAREPEIIDLANCLNAMGAKIFGAGRSQITITGVSKLSGVNHAVVPDRIEAGTYALAAATVGDGTSIIRENIFENRFMHCPELSRMGADIDVRGREAIVRGVKELKGAPVMATDLRASASLIAAGMAARGETHVGRVYHLDRGFERIEIKLGNCGARIRREKE